MSHLEQDFLFFAELSLQTKNDNIGDTGLGLNTILYPVMVVGRQLTIRLGNLYVELGVLSMVTSLSASNRD